MSRSKNEIIISILLVFAAFLVIGYNIFSVEMQKIEIQRQIEENANIEKEREALEREMLLEVLRSEEARQLAEYYVEYGPVKAEFMEKTIEFSEKINDKIINTAELKKLTTGRLEAALDYKEKLIGIENVPAPLEAFSIYELEFIESDIKTINLVLSYYNSENYTNFNSSAIDKFYEDTQSLLGRAEKELRRVYEQYNLEYLLEGSS
ncbi:MAG: hypothetical protein WC549_07985 [Actinomycetota bacterium]